MITPDQFFAKWNGKGIDWDHYYGFQCMDLYHQYNFECVGGRDIPAPAAKDVWNKYDSNAYERIPNGPTNFPQKGDIVIWGTGVGQYGHIAVCVWADSMKLQSFDQNWPLSSLSHFQNHNYTGVLGWLRPKKKSDNVVVTDPAPISIPISQPTVENVTPTPEATAPTEPTPEPQEPTGESPSEVVPGSSSDSMEPPISSGDTTTGMDSSLNPYSGPTLSSAYATDQEAPQAELPSNTLNILQRVLATLFIWLRRVVR